MSPEITVETKGTESVDALPPSIIKDRALGYLRQVWVQPFFLGHRLQSLIVQAFFLGRDEGT